LHDPLHKISFVSGKGGVGKTLLAVNFAWVCAHLGKTLLVDLDFQNQGATGLLSSFIQEASHGAIDYILGSEQVTNGVFVTVDNNLEFLPAVPLNHPPKHSELFDACQHPTFKSDLACFLDKVGEYGFRIVILDCHGGLDMVSLASHRLSDHTLVITEPDRVNGTLELLDFYQVAQPPNVATSDSNEKQCLTQDLSRPVELIVNRIPPKYRFNDLQRVYGGVLATYKARLNISDNVLAYIPAEEYVADSYGEVPFIIPVAPNCVAAQKLHLLAFKLFSTSFAIPAKYKPLSKLVSPRRRQRIDRTVISAESRNIRAIVNTFAAISCLYVFLFFSMISYPVLMRNADWSKKDTNLLVGLFCLFASIVSAVYLKAVFGLNRYYKDKYQIQRNLLRTEHGEASLWRRLAIVRLLFLRAAMMILPLVVIVTLVLGVLAMLGLWLEQRSTVTG
jgi:cellulose biosynthesis protein BcsQ